MTEVVAQRPRLERTRDGAAVAGVCAGSAAALGIDVAILRIGFLVATALGGLGIALYAVAVAAIPLRSDNGRQRSVRWPTAIAFAILAGCILALLGEVGLVLPGGVLGPATFAAMGVALIWRRAGGEVRVDLDRPWLASGIRAASGVILVSMGVVLAVVQSGGIGPAVAAALAAGAVAGGIGLLVAPRLRRARAEADSERRERIRGEERELVAARLHDSVLQTLALLQREPDPDRARALARRQDRELRAWLYGADLSDDHATLGAALRSTVAEIEHAYGIAVDLVQPVDVPMDAKLEALVEATREAITNAAKHAGIAEVNVLVQIVDEEARVFVRDRGVGFVPSEVPANRRGIRDSIRARIERVGGVVTIDSELGHGVEIKLVVPRESVT